MENARGICDRSGFEFPLSELVKEWTGLMVHPRFLDHRHPQDFVRGVAERPLPYTRPEAADDFLGTNEVTAASL
jgi:hypothetical protein